MHGFRQRTYKEDEGSREVISVVLWLDVAIFVFGIGDNCGELQRRNTVSPLRADKESNAQTKEEHHPLLFGFMQGTFAHCGGMIVAV